MNVVSILLVLTMSISSYGALDYDQGAKMSYDELLASAYELEEMYPELIDVAVIGYSTLGKEIVSVTLSKGATKYISIDAGIHAREYVSSFVLLETLEIYCEELTRPGSHVFAYDLHQLITQVSIATILTVNPDGLQLVLEDANWKANANGIDLNRNFDSKYFADKKLHDIWGWDGVTDKSWAYASEPGPAYFAGYRPDSEIEIQLAKEFYKTKDFRLFMTMHTRGQMLFYDRPNMTQQYQIDAKRIADGIYGLNGYELQVADRESYLTYIRNGSSGTTTDYVSGEFEKPAFTIELMETGSIQPAPQDTWRQALNEFINIPAYLMYEAANMNYGNYKVYIDGVYYSDYSEVSFANEIARLRGGEVYSYQGDPYSYSVKKTLREASQLATANKLKALNVISGDNNGDLLIDNSLNRAQLATLLCRLNKVDLQASKFSENMGFEDVKEEDWFASYVNYAKSQGWMNGVSDTKFDPQGLVSEEMIATVLLRVLGYSTNWGDGVASMNGLGIRSQVEDSKEVCRGEVFDYIYKSLHRTMFDSQELLLDYLDFETDYFESFYGFSVDDDLKLSFYDEDLQRIDYWGKPVYDIDEYEDMIHKSIINAFAFSTYSSEEVISKDYSLELYNKVTSLWIKDQTIINENMLFENGMSIKYNRNNVPYFYNTLNRVIHSFRECRLTYIDCLEAICAEKDNECHVYDKDGNLLSEFEGYESISSGFGQYVCAYKDGVTYILDKQGEVINMYEQKVFFVLNK